MSSDQPDAQYRITLAVPKWNVKAISTAPTFIKALNSVTKVYRNDTKKDGVRIPMTPEATPARLEHLDFSTADRALKFLVEKIQPSDYRRWTKKLDTPGPQWAHRVAVEECYNPEIPTLRKRDAHFIGTVTAVVRILQRFGFELIDGFEEHIKAGKDDTAKSSSAVGEGEVEIAGQSDESSLEQEGFDQDAELGTALESRKSRDGWKAD